MREKWVDTNRRLSCASGALGLARLRRVSDDKLAAASILALLCVLSWAWHTSAAQSTHGIHARKRRLAVASWAPAELCTF